MRFLIDLSPSWVPFLQNAGFEAVHWSAVGSVDASDRTLLQWAAGHDHVVVTNLRFFGDPCRATQRRKPSVIQIRADLLTPVAIGSAVLRAIAQTERELAEGALISIDLDRARVRILPLGS